jgi:ribosomal protein L3 glutamine methyltransferase
MTTVRDLIDEGARQFDAAGLCFGHGSDNAFDEAAEIVFFAAGLRHEDAPGAYRRHIDVATVESVRALFATRIRDRVPAAYLTRRMWFAGREFYVDERVLVPRSPIAELIERRFAPWLAPAQVGGVLDIGTGSGCLAIAIACAFPHAVVDAVDLSPDALAVAAINVARHQVDRRVRLLQSNVYECLAEETRYDLIVSNPPYVSDREMAELPREYRHEPAIGLEAGHDGLAVVHRILAGASQHLTPDGVLVVEVGDSEDALVSAYPDMPFTWLEFERGGGGVFLLEAQQLRVAR